MEEANEVKNFWNWFIQNQNSIEFSKEKTIIQLDRQVNLLWPQLSWEIGRGFLKKQYFALSPNLNQELLEFTKSLIAQAPVLEDWEFYYAKPKKDWDLRWEMYNDDGNIIVVDGRNWEYVLFKFSDGTYDIEINPVGWNWLWEKEILTTAVEMALLGELGEETLMNRIYAKEIVKEFSIENQKKSSLFKNLKKYILEQELSNN